MSYHTMPTWSAVCLTPAPATKAATASVCAQLWQPMRMSAPYKGYRFHGGHRRLVVSAAEKKNLLGFDC